MPNKTTIPSDHIALHPDPIRIADFVCSNKAAQVCSSFLDLIKIIVDYMQQLREQLPLQEKMQLPNQAYPLLPQLL